MFFWSTAEQKQKEEERTKKMKRTLSFKAICRAHESHMTLCSSCRKKKVQQQRQTVGALFFRLSIFWRDFFFWPRGDTLASARCKCCSGWKGPFRHFLARVVIWTLPSYTTWGSAGAGGNSSFIARGPQKQAAAGGGSRRWGVIGYLLLLLGLLLLLLLQQTVLPSSEGKEGGGRKEKKSCFVSHGGLLLRNRVEQTALKVKRNVPAAACCVIRNLNIGQSFPFPRHQSTITLNGSSAPRRDAFSNTPNLKTPYLVS